MRFAAQKKYIRDSQVFRGTLPTDHVRREEFTASEYKRLHSFTRQWIKDAHDVEKRWYRTVIYNFILIMCNTGMRVTEARSLRWSDISNHSDGGRKYLIINVWGKKKRRQLVAAGSVGEYFDRIRAISKAKKPTDFVFTTFKGDKSSTLYGKTIAALLSDAGLLVSTSGSRRSTYCFRHTYATFRLSEGVDVYFLAEQMGTSVKMIEDHYGHVSAVKNRGQILKGFAGWSEAITPSPPGKSVQTQKRPQSSAKR
jgi:integrase